MEMEKSFWRSLKSGTDVRGIACEGVEGEHITLTDEVCASIAKGFLAWLANRSGKSVNALRVAVGHDSRISAERISSAVIGALTECGAQVQFSALSSTPAMFMITLDNELDGSIQITASHHPWNRNGLKFFTPDGGLEGEDIAYILDLCAEGELPEVAEGGSCTDVDYMSCYAAHLRDIIKKGVNAADYDHPLAGFKIAVDAGNGAGGFYARDVLEPLGADVSGSCFLEPDGRFPNHIPNPENAAAMQSICSATLNSNSDLGIIFDTDVDRAGAVDASGSEINRNRLIALAAAIALESVPGGTIVTDSTTSLGLKKFIELLGGKHYRYRRGYRNVINKAIELEAQGIAAPLAIETSGHAALRENYYLDDGAYLVTKIIIKYAALRAKGESLESLTSSLAMPAEEHELRFKITVPDFAAQGNKILAALGEYAAAQDGWHISDDNREGIRVCFGENGEEGFFLLRLSVHDPIMPLNLESETAGGCKAIAQALYALLKTVDGLDLSPIEKFLEI